MLDRCKRYCPSGRLLQPDGHDAALSCALIWKCRPNGEEVDDVEVIAPRTMGLMVLARTQIARGLVADALGDTPETTIPTHLWPRGRLLPSDGVAVSAGVCAARQHAGFLVDHDCGHCAAGGCPVGQHVHIVTHADQFRSSICVDPTLEV